MSALELILKNSLAAVNVEAILSELDACQATGQLVLIAKAEFCETFSVAENHSVFKHALVLEELSIEELLAAVHDKALHVYFLSYEVMGARGYRVNETETVSSRISALINSGATILSYCSPVSNVLAAMARIEVPKAFSGLQQYFEKQLSIIILTGLNNNNKFVDMLSSFTENFPASKSLELVIVINGSQDASVYTAIDKLSQAYDLKLVYPRENLGYGGGMNAGIAVAKGKYIALMPDDLAFSKKDPLAPLVQLLEDKPEVGIVGAYTGGYCFSLADPENADGLEYPFWVLPVGNVNGPQRCAWIKNNFVEVDYASALCFVFRRELGGYEPNYYPYGLEEVAFCLRAKQQGYKVFLTDAGISHDFEASVTRRNWLKNNKINAVHLPYANASYELLTTVGEQLRDPQQYFGFSLYSVKGQMARPANPPILLQHMQGQVAEIAISTAPLPS
ncbi:glycosyltransferase [Dasania marina]|uniref:glycosyltransferase n=1 Tax=Dasania marina TaxID=471499 RepID=UPI00036233CB|nr:glycosyltransferase [Dasania marina]